MKHLQGGEVSLGATRSNGVGFAGSPHVNSEPGRAFPMALGRWADRFWWTSGEAARRKLVQAGTDRVRRDWRAPKPVRVSRVTPRVGTRGAGAHPGVRGVEEHDLRPWSEPGAPPGTALVL